MTQWRTNTRAIVVFCFSAMVVIGVFLFVHLDRFLVVSDPLPSSLDALFTLGGEDTRLAYSKQLYVKYSPVLWLISYADKNLIRSLEKEKIDTSRITLVDTCKNTRSEIRYMEKWVRDRALSGRLDTGTAAVGPPRIGIVSNWYHMRRINMIIRAQAPKNRLRYYYLAVPGSYESYRNTGKRWWRQKNMRDVVFLEWEKIIYYFVMHPLLILPGIGSD
jgi:uncharacterized SAM-binding protein YcdF (DUF218 family)